MRAAVATGVGKIEVQELDEPSPGPGEVKLAVHAVGVCHSDLIYLEGKVPSPQYPIVLGHEGAGVVSEVGPGVTTVAPGDHVVCTIVGTCGHCFYCVRGEPSLCEENVLFTGRMLDGTTRLSRDGQPVFTLPVANTRTSYGSSTPLSPSGTWSRFVVTCRSTRCAASRAA